MCDAQPSSGPASMSAVIVVMRGCRLTWPRFLTGEGCEFGTGAGSVVFLGNVMLAPTLTFLPVFMFTFSRRAVRCTTVFGMPGVFRGWGLGGVIAHLPSVVAGGRMLGCFLGGAGVSPLLS